MRNVFDFNDLLLDFRVCSIRMLRLVLICAIYKICCYVCHIWNVLGVNTLTSMLSKPVFILKIGLLSFKRDEHPKDSLY